MQEHDKDEKEEEKEDDEDESYIGRKYKSQTFDNEGFQVAAKRSRKQ